MNGADELALVEQLLADAGFERDLARSLCVDSFQDFVRAAWSTIEPTRALLPSVALNALCAALQAVAEGRIRRLAIACPPGVSKSLIGAVAFPAWLLLRTGGRARIMCGSYSWTFAERDSRRCRDLIASPWFRDLVAGAWNVRDDADTRADYSTTTGGRRLVVSTGGKTLGERATVQIIDDALSGADVHSPAAKAEAIRWLNEVLPSRLEDAERDPRVIIGQRLTSDDPIANAVAQGWTLLALPAVLGDDEAPCEVYDDAGALVWRDPRKPGEPLVSLLGVDALARLRVELGSAAYAAQYLGRPQDDSAAMFKRAWLTRRWSTLPDRFDRVVVALDATFKEGSASDFAVIAVWGAIGADRYLVEQWRRQAGFADTLAALRDVAARYPFAKVVIEQAANGHAILEQLRREVPGIVGVKPLGSKLARMASVQAIVESGAIVLPEHAAWVGDWVDEVSSVPSAKHDDQADAMAHALRELAIAAFVEDEPCGGILYNVHESRHGAGWVRS